MGSDLSRELREGRMAERPERPDLEGVLQTFVDSPSGPPLVACAMYAVALEAEIDRLIVYETEAELAGRIREQAEEIKRLRAQADAAEGLAEDNAELEEALATLRDAWNAHFERCTLDSEVIAQLSADGSIFEQVREWMNAPSNTASAEEAE